jgi:hypothetical protein
VRSGYLHRLNRAGCPLPIQARARQPVRGLNFLRVLLTARPTAYRHLSGQTLDVEANEQHRRLYTFAHLGGHQVGISQLASAQGAPAFRRL